MSETTIDKLVENKLDYYGDAKTDNFVLTQELTVEITLNEYRNLVTNKAMADERVSKAEKDKWERLNEISELKDKVKEVIRNLNRYINKYGVLKDEEEEYEDE